MAGELFTSYESGATLYGVVLNAAGQVWNTATSSFEAINVANWTDYDLPLTEQSTSGLYVGDFPAGIVAAGSYRVVVYEQAGGSPAASDSAVAGGSVAWDGSQEVTLDELSMFDPASDQVVASSVVGNVGGDLVGNVQGSVQGNVAGSVGSVVAGVSVAALDADVVTAAAIAADAGDELADALLGRSAAIEGTFSPRQALSLILAAVAGPTSGFSGAAPASGAQFFAPDGTTPRITVDTDAGSNRTQISLSPGT